MNPFHIESEAKNLKRLLDENSNNPKIWGSDDPDLNEVMHQYALLTEASERLLAAIVDGYESELKECQEFCQQTKDWKVLVPTI